MSKLLFNTPDDGISALKEGYAWGIDAELACKIGAVPAMIYTTGTYRGELNISEFEKAYNKDTIGRALKVLDREGLIRNENLEPEDIVKVLKTKSGKGGIGNKWCEWCGIRTIVLHEHHYPVSKVKGGEDTVNICPNCHYEYHSLLRNSWALCPPSADRRD